MAKKTLDTNRQLFDESIRADVRYSGDQPNSDLRSFVEAHRTPYDPQKDDYSIAGFTEPITSTKATAIYNLHSYHQGKKPHDAIRQYIRHFTKEGNIVMDPFSGSGGTSLAALMEGRNAIAIDRSPAATFITKTYCTPVVVRQLSEAFEDFKALLTKELAWLYQTCCDRCGGDATITFTVYSYVFNYPRCLAKVPLFDCVEVASASVKGKAKTIPACPHCFEKGHVEEISTRSERFEAVPVLVNYVCNNGCKPARAERRHNDSDKRKQTTFAKVDVKRIEEIEGRPIPYWFPDHKMMHVEGDDVPWGVKWRAGTSNFRTVAALFTKRNLWALSIIREFAN